jgi:dihydroorotate dehydrogenase
MTDLVNRNQAIFDAIIEAVTPAGPGSFEINTKKFIETFNNHRDRALCMSLRIGPEPSSTDIEKLADALEKADWSGVSIGNKVMLKGAIEILRSIGVAQAPPVKDQAALFRVCQRRK